MLLVNSVRKITVRQITSTTTTGGTPPSPESELPIAASSPVAFIADASASPPPKSSSTSQGIFFAVARLSIRYKKPARYDDELELLVVGLPCAGVKVEHRYELRRGEDLLMTAETTLVCVTREGRAVPVPRGLLP